MRAEYVNPFIKECLKIFKEMAGIELLLSKAFRKDPKMPSRGVFVNFKILGDVEGNVSLQFSEETALKIVSSMMGGMKVVELDELAQSAISELGNMITGRATIAIAEFGWAADITPPHIS
jgi:chemotaxis protein CheX